LDPHVRRGEEQTHLAASIDRLLSVDGYRVVVISENSGHPVYSVQRAIQGSVRSGKPKNLIFAAINTKPDLYFSDALDNNIAIRNATDALIYDDFQGNSCLRWSTLVKWWQERERLADPEEARRALYKRLLESVIATGSPGQYAIFRTFYREYPKVLGDDLPGLVPEVYLHYDPRTKRQRGPDPVLLRQRMDFILLLDQHVRVVIEIDGVHHYTRHDGMASPHNYANMLAEDRRLRLAGYELYRFGGAEFSDTVISGTRYLIGPQSQQVTINFFDEIWRRYGLDRKRSNRRSVA
jgi:hypothetical protein